MPKQQNDRSRDVDGHIPSTAMAVANWFLEKSREDPSVPPCDQLKLHKLLYYAQAWHLAYFRTPLFPEDIEAWPHGPVVRDIQIEFKDYGDKPITELGTRLEEIGEGEYSVVTPRHEGSRAEFLDAVWNAYKEYSGVRLSNATHAEGEPWEIVSRHYDLADKPTISTDVIESVFRNRVAN